MRVLKFIVINIVLLIFLPANAQEAQLSQKKLNAKKTNLTKIKSTQSKNGVDVINKKPKPERLKIKVLPYLSLVNKENLKSYKWWTSEQKKVPKIYKKLLKKLLLNLRKKNIYIKYDFTKSDDLNKEKVHELIESGVDYLISGEILFQTKTNQKFQLRDFKMKSLKNPTRIYIQKDEKSISNLKDFHELTDDLAAHLRFSNKTQKYDKKQNLPAMYVRFEIPLVFNEIEKIMQVVKTKVPGVKSLSIHSLKANETIFSLRPVDLNSLKYIKSLYFVKGPYKKILDKNTLILKPYPIEESKKEESNAPKQ